MATARQRRGQLSPLLNMRKARPVLRVSTRRTTTLRINNPVRISGFVHDILASCDTAPSRLSAGEAIAHDLFENYSDDCDMEEGRVLYFHILNLL